MARLRTLLQLRTAARRAADQENTQFVADAEANDWINQSVANWHAFIARSNPHRFYATTDVTTTAGTAGYALPADFASVLGVDRLEGPDGPSQRRVPLEAFNFQERRGPDGSLGDGRVRFRVQGSLGTAAGGTEQLVFDPDPGAHTFRVHYVRAPQVLTIDTHTVDGVFGWDEWIVYDVAARMARKAEELELAATLVAERDRLKPEIELAAAERDYGSAPKVADVRRRRRYIPRAR